MSDSDFNPFSSGAIERISPTTAPQREILTSAKMSAEANVAFNEIVALNVDGEIDPDLFSDSFSALINRHDALRATFSSRADEICLQENPQKVVSILDLSECNDVFIEREKSELYQKIAESPMDLEDGPLIFSWLIKLPEKKSIIIIAAHHLICDGWSFGIILKELSEAYNNTGSLDHMPDAPSFFDFADYQSASHVLNKDEDYWINKFAVLPEPLDLPVDKSRPKTRPFQAARFDYHLSDTTVKALKTLTGLLKTSNVNVALSAYYILLHRLTGGKDFVVGLPVAGQASLNQLDLVGHLVQLLPIRVSVDPDISFSDFASTVKKAVMDATEHPNFTFGNLVKDLDVQRSRVPLVSVLFNMDQAMPPLDFKGNSGNLEMIPRVADNFELFLNFVPGQGDWLVEVTYSTVLFDEDSVKQWMHFYEDIVAAVANDSALSLGDLAGRGKEYEKQVELLEKWNSVPVSYELTGHTIDELVTKACCDNVDHFAIIYQEKSLTYAEVNRKISLLASKLVDAGLQREQPVAVLMQRSEKLPVVLLAIMKAGGAYLPLDPEHPKDRIAYILEESNAVEVIVNEDLQHLLPADKSPMLIEHVWQDLEQYDNELIDSRAKTDSLAYVIYTSGSTGRPKGVMVEHRSVCNRLFWMQDMFHLGSDDRILQKTPYTFDVSVWELFSPLISGATLVMAKPEGHRDPGYIAKTIIDQQITLTHFVPSMLAIFLKNEDVSKCSNLKRVVCSGEAMNKEHERKFLHLLPNTELYNFYGPTEAAVEVTTWRCSIDSPYQFVPIGRTVPNTQLHVLDEKLKRVPVGVQGELYIGGIQVARGYMNNQQLTRKAFIDDPFSRVGGKLYKTGDLVRYHDDGVIEYLGRNDFQVKVRGQRIELGEIETVLNSQESIIQSAVIAKESEQGQQLVAYIASKGKSPSREDLVNQLSQKLPSYMVPKHYIFLDELPLTSSGKTDRKALLELEIALDSGGEGELPKTESEIYLATLWASLLDVEDVFLEDNFFDLGGHSLLAVNAAVEIKRDKGCEVPLPAFISSNLSQIAANYIDAEFHEETGKNESSKASWFSSLFKR